MISDFDLLTWTCGIHVAILPFALLGLHRYTDRSSYCSKFLDDTNKFLLQLRSSVTRSLDSFISPVFDRSVSEPRIITTEFYAERQINPVGSEAYRQALRAFIDSDSGPLADYGFIFRARNRWSKWARVLSWIVLSLALWEAVCAAVFGVLGKLIGVQIPEIIAKSSFAPTAILVFSVFLCLGMMLHYNDIISKKEAIYHDIYVRE